MTSSKESTLFLILEGIMRYDAELDPSQTNVCSVTWVMKGGSSDNSSSSRNIVQMLSPTFTDPCITPVYITDDSEGPKLWIDDKGMYVTPPFQLAFISCDA